VGSSPTTRANISKKKMAKIVDYVKETYDEMIHKVSWPSWNDLQSSAIIVSIASLIIALMVLTMDIVFGVHQHWVWQGVLGFFYSLIG
jgi:preprotein translocase subunit SecE